MVGYSLELEASLGRGSSWLETRQRKTAADNACNSSTLLWLEGQVSMDSWQKGVFSVRSCSATIETVILPGASHIDSYVWLGITPLKVEAFVWLATSDKLNTKESLWRIVIIDANSNLCPLCNSSAETATHFLLHCRGVWLINALWLWCTDWSMPASVDSLFP
jgi:hypothetical protein